MNTFVAIHKMEDGRLLAWDTEGNAWEWAQDFMRWDSANPAYNCPQPVQKTYEKYQEYEDDIPY